MVREHPAGNEGELGCGFQNPPRKSRPVTKLVECGQGGATSRQILNPTWGLWQAAKIPRIRAPAPYRPRATICDYEFMNFRVGDNLSITNVITKESAPFLVEEIGGCDGHAIVYGTYGRHGIWVPASFGRQHIKEQPVAFTVMVPTPETRKVVEFIEACHGLPWVVDKGDERLVIPNTRNMPGWYDGSKEKTDMLNHCCAVIRLWDQYVKLGYRLPVWYRDLQMHASDPTDQPPADGGGLEVPW